MLSAGEVGVIFAVKDESSATLQRIADEFNKIQAIVDKVTAAVDKIGGADSGLGKLQEALGLTAKAGEDASRTITEGFGKVDGAVEASVRQVNALKDSFLAAAEAAKAIQVASSHIGGGGGSGGPHGGGGIVSSLVGPNSIGVGGLVSGAFSIPGMVAEFGGYEAFEKAADLDQARVLMQNKGVTPDKIDEAQRMAFSMSPKIGESAASIMKMMADIGTPLNQGTTGNSAIDAAERHIGTVGDALTVFRSLDGKNGTDLEKQVFQLVKSGELRNAVASDGEFDNAMSAMVKGSIANPMVGPEQWFQFISKARSAGMRADNDWIYKVGPELITEFNAPGAGTAWSSLYQGIVSGKLTKGSMGEMDAIHAFDDNPDKVTRDKNGNVTHLKPGAMGSIGDAFAHNPGEGMQMLIDRIDTKLTADNHGATLTDEARKKGEEDWLTNVFGNRNAAQFSMTLAEQKARLGRGVQAADNAADLPTAAGNVRNNDPNFTVAQFQAALSNLAANMGNLAMPAAIASIQALADAAGKAADFLGMLKKPELNKDGIKDDLFGKKGDGNILRTGADWIEHNWEGDGSNMPHRPVSHPMAGPSGWANAVPPAVSLQPGGAITGVAPIVVTVQNNMTESTITAKINAAISGALGNIRSAFTSGASNSAAGFDGRAHPQTPDASAYPF
jgi:hypothetical protein